MPSLFVEIRLGKLANDLTFQDQRLLLPDSGGWQATTSIVAVHANTACGCGEAHHIDVFKRGSRL